jgi:hypothetical protein
VISAHNKSNSTSTSIFITRHVFRNFTCKNLSISAAINVYNHYMSEVDIANQCWAAFTTLWEQNTCYWKSLFHWLLDIVLTNTYLLAKASCRPQIGESKKYYTYRRFLEALAKTLMTYSETLEHNQILKPTRAYCAYCRNNQLNWQPKFQQRRSFGADITNIGGGSRGGFGGRFRGSRTRWGCDQCNIPLCKIGDCWCLWHENFN